MIWSEDALIEALIKLSKELNKSDITSTECNKCPYTANTSTYRTRFGSWNNAKEKAGLLTKNKIVTNEDLIISLQNFYKVHGKAPTQRECLNKNNLYGPNTYKEHFGTWEKALEVAKIPYNELRSNQLSNDELLQVLKDIYITEQRTPKHEDCPGLVMQIHRRFGSFTNALQQAEIPIPDSNPIFYLTDEKLLETLRKFYKENGRAPIQKDCTEVDYLKSHATYCKRFGTFLKAIDAANIPRNSLNSSILEQEVTNFLKETSNFNIKSGFLPNSQEIDILIPEINLGIEINGLYWHSDSVKQDRKYHLQKTLLSEKQGIRLIHIFEHEWRTKQNIVKSRLLNLLGQAERIFARKCKIREVDSSTTKLFLDNNHIQGSVNSSIRLGLYYKDTLVAVMTFSKSRFSNKYEYELVRYCNLLNTSVVGGASKLFNYFINVYNPTSVVSYSDKRWNTGKLYQILNFNFSHTSEPNYWYFKGLTVESRQKYQKHKLQNLLPNFDASKTEYENMIANGYKRFFDCGNDVYVWNK